MALQVDVKVLAPPVLEFGPGGEFADPKVGLEQKGPFSLRFGVAHKSQVRLGLLGPADLLDTANAWFDRCQGRINSEDLRPGYPDFPGFSPTFRSNLVVDSRWQAVIDSMELERALGLTPQERFQAVLQLYSHGLERLADSEVRPDVAVCCLPDSVVEQCHHISNPLSAKERRWVKTMEKARSEGQLPLFDDWETEETEEDLLYRDFRRALKARAMAYRMPIQIGTPHLFLDSDTNQDPATRAWNVCVALFYKAGGIPWRLRTEGPETCFVGISFHHLKTKRKHLVFSSLAQAFSTEGDGFALRGDAVPWDHEQGRRPHLSEPQAAGLALQVLEEYRERLGHDPVRVVFHKSSQFDERERAGFQSALRRIPIVEMVNLQPATLFRLVRQGAYPPNRGTLCRVNSTRAYLFTTGYIPEWHTYPGAHVPLPVEVLTGDGSDINRIAEEVLGLSRMNWNTARDTSGAPITLNFSRQVGGIMAEVGIQSQPNPSYRYYM